nr:MAG TPA: hypothetical protein [Caudoviricetes sp.]
MTLDEAIKHALEVAENTTCAGCKVAGRIKEKKE